MKKLLMLFAMLGLLFAAPVPAEAQILDKISKKVKKKVDRKVDREIDKSIDKGMEETEDVITGEDDGTTKEEEKKQGDVPVDEKGQPVETTESQDPELVWSKYDFVPGDKVLFEDNLVGEENGEFPSRWDLVKGTVENAEFGGENIIMFRGGNPKIIPYLKNREQDYLPEVFTIEFDLYVNNVNSFEVFFYDAKNQRKSAEHRSLTASYNGLRLYNIGSYIPDKGSIENKWAHIAVAYTRGKFKAYINETRLINIPRLEFEPTGITLSAYSATDQYKFYIKNFRLAEGGVKYYDQVLQDGKIVATGIRFDTGKATLKPESMGVINEIVKLMQKYPEIKFSVEGHTDSDGDDASNLKLSDDRATTVANTLVKLGISEERLSTKGFGESVPIDTNQSPEGKANNRRVEFVKVEFN
ncbi:MAG: OmpA family protein [Bacteroidia bacterium]|nr:OmpA family protein [Bacteroidia bacterium]NNJ80960.1 OmpA family protein [Flavobacteriaceae bacterium]NNM09488.1 OmpA family protein [Flavobacteriaceae bacterium]